MADADTSIKEFSLIDFLNEAMPKGATFVSEVFKEIQRCNF